MLGGGLAGGEGEAGGGVGWCAAGAPFELLGGGCAVEGEGDEGADVGVALAEGELGVPEVAGGGGGLGGGLEGEAWLAIDEDEDGVVLCGGAVEGDGREWCGAGGGGGGRLGSWGGGGGCWGVGGCWGGGGRRGGAGEEGGGGGGV